MSSEWQTQFDERCPNCGQRMLHRERLKDGETEHQREGYQRLSVWVLECSNCEGIVNMKRSY